MDENVNILKEIGAQKIHTQTHIPREFIQSIIHESFEGLQSVQFFGFVSILEKTYDLDLSDFKARARIYFNEENDNPDELKKVFVVAKKKKSNSGVYIFIGILIFISFIYYSFVYLSSLETIVAPIDNTKIEDAQKNIAMVPEKELSAAIDTDETNTSLASVDENTAQEFVGVDSNMTGSTEEVVATRSLKILPKRKIWAGYINIKTNQKYQKIFREEFSIDTDKDWLLLFGSGTAKLEVNGEVQKFSSQQNMRFKYVDGKFSKITVTEFKILNRGRKW